MLDIVLILAIFATLLVIIALSQPLAGRLKLSPVVLLAVIGAAIGTASAMFSHAALPLSSRFEGIAKLLADLPICRSGPISSSTCSCLCSSLKLQSPAR